MGINKKLDYDLAIVLGAGVYESKRRAEYASELLRENPKIPIIVTGGIPKKFAFIQKPHNLSEAEIMEKILRERGIAQKIYKEELAQNTKENFTGSKSLISKIKPKKIMIIDGLIHLKRSLKIAKENLPEYDFTGFPIPIDKGKILVNLFVEGLSYLLEFDSKRKIPKEYRFYNNPKQP